MFGLFLTHYYFDGHHLVHIGHQCGNYLICAATFIIQGCGLSFECHIYFTVLFAAKPLLANIGRIWLNNFNELNALVQNVTEYQIQERDFLIF